MRDDPVQADAAARMMEEASTVIIPVAVFCELAWVLRSVYREPADRVSAVIRAYLGGDTVKTDEAAVLDGLKTLSRGGDFADGAVARQGRDCGAEVFASFDRKARNVLAEMGYATVSP